MIPTISLDTVERLSKENPAPQGTYYHLESVGEKHVEVQLRSKRRLSPFPKLIDYAVYRHEGDVESAISSTMRILSRDNR